MAFYQDLKIVAITFHANFCCQNGITGNRVLNCSVLKRSKCPLHIQNVKAKTAFPSTKKGSPDDDPFCYFLIFSVLLHPASAAWSD